MLLTEEQTEKVDAVVQPTQLIAFALIAGLLMFLSLSLALVGTDSINGNVDLITLVGVVIGVVAIGKSMLLPNFIAASGIRAAREKLGKDTNQLVSSFARIYQSKKIFQMAFLEGAAFANLVFFFLYHSAVALIVVAIAVAGMVLVFPRRQVAYDWIVDQLEAL